MRVMVMVKATPDSEAAVLPDEKLLAELGRFNEELVRAGVMLAGEGLHPSSKGARRPAFERPTGSRTRRRHRQGGVARNRRPAGS